MKSVLGYSQQVLSSMTMNWRSQSSSQSPFFYFSGSDSGLQWDSQSSSASAWPFSKGYTCLLKFKCHAGQVFDPQSLPVLFTCFAEGYGGFECYLNAQFQIIYRVLARTYSKPTADSNGVKVAEIQPDQWNLFAIQHDKPYLARAQLIAILNDKQPINLPVDYPKFDQKAVVTKVMVCKGCTSNLSYFSLFKEHFSHLKKFVSQV